MRDTSLISQMAQPGAFTETLSDARPVSITTDVTSTSAVTSAVPQSAEPSLFDTMPDRGASIFPATISPLTLDDQYGPPTVPFAVADATYGTSGSSNDELATLIRRYLRDRAQSASVASTSAAAPARSNTAATASPAPPALYRRPPVQAAPPGSVIQPPGVSTGYGFPQAAQDPPQSYSFPQANPVPVQTVTVTQVAQAAPVTSFVTQAAPVTSYVVQPPAAAPASVAPLAAPVQNYARPQTAPVVTYTVQPPAAAAPVHTYASPPSQSPVIVQQPLQQPQQQQQQQAVRVVQQPSFVVPAPVGSYLLQSPAAAPGGSHSYSSPVQSPLLTPRLAFVAPFGPDTAGRQRDRQRDDDSGLVISLGDASIQLGGGSGTSIRLGGGRRSDRARDSGGSGSGNSITIIAGGSTGRDAPAPVGPPAPNRSYSTPRDPPRTYSAPKDPPREPPSSYSAPMDPPRNPPSSYSPPRDPPRNPPSSYSPPRDPPRNPPSSYSAPMDPPSSYGSGRNADQTLWRPVSSTRPLPPPSTASIPASDDAKDDAADDADTYTSYEGQTRSFPPADSSVGRTGMRDTAQDAPAPAPPPRTYGAPPRDPPRTMYGAPPARDPPSPSPPPRTYGAPPMDPPSSMYGAPPAQDPPAPPSMYGSPPADPPRDPPPSSYGAPARDPVPAAPTVQATPVQLVQAVPVAVFNPRPPPRPRKKHKHHFLHHKRPRGRLVKDTIIREVSRPVRTRAPPLRGPRPFAAPQLFLATVPQNTQSLTLASPARNPPANPPSSYNSPQRNPSARAAPPVGVVRDTLVRQVLYDQFQDDYAKLFYKGAILIGALALLPAAAAVPLAAGRRKRSLFDAEPAAGAELPVELRQRLGAALPELAQLDTSECLQRELCRALRQVEQSPFRDSFLLYYAV